MNNTLIHAYTAGYIDGDGCFSIGKTTIKKTNYIKYQASLTITSTNRSVLEFFSTCYGGSIADFDRKKYPQQKPQYRLTLRHSDSINLIEKILPYLVERKDQAELFREFITTESKEIKDFFIEKMFPLKHTINLVKESDKIILREDMNTIKPTENDFAYLAGFIDAECWLGVQKYVPKNNPNPVFKIQLSCNNTKFPAFQWLMRRFGGHVKFVERKSKYPQWNDQILWRQSSKALSKILPKVLQYLRYKKPVCEELMKLYALTIPNGGDRQSTSFKEMYNDLIIRKLDIVHKIHSLNLKGVNNI